MCETKYLNKYIAAVCKTFSKVIFDVKNSKSFSSYVVLVLIRKPTGFKSLRLSFWEINQVTSICQIDFWTKFAEKV